MASTVTPGSDPTGNPSRKTAMIMAVLPQKDGAPNPKRHIHAGRLREWAMITGVAYLGRPNRHDHVGWGRPVRRARAHIRRYGAGRPLQVERGHPGGDLRA